MKNGSLVGEPFSIFNAMFQFWDTFLFSKLFDRLFSDPIPFQQID